MEWLNNPWVVGIGGSVLGGLLVTVVSRALLSRRDRREYTQKLLSANREVIYAIRQGIPEGHVADRRVVGLIISATARKYAVDRADLQDPTQVAEELVKEIMDSSFISASTKEQYCGQLASLSPPPLQEQQELVGIRGHRPAPKSDLAEYRSRTVTLMSAMLGTMTAVMAIVYMLSDRFAADSGSELPTFLPPLIATMAVTMLLSFFLSVLLRTRRTDDSSRRSRGHEALKRNGDAT